MLTDHEPRLETKFARFGEALSLTADEVIEGYASLFGAPDQGKDIVTRGAYAASLAAHQARGSKVKMLWQHDPSHPIGVWDEILEDDTGLRVKGRILTETQKGAEAAALVRAGAIEGLSIGYRTVKATRDKEGHRRLEELQLWEVSLVTFPMLPSARLSRLARREAEAAKSDASNEGLRALADALRAATRP
ncbi:HK97 family phage prohead protease [Tritonibacter sp. SIMBA_163]|uniref:HK97 family phage prohead protease n=1 Tax=Tritonibacter sp. SIMBA_163 TaxID=3080868 RepID=UPI00397EECB4